MQLKELKAPKKFFDSKPKDVKEIHNIDSLIIRNIGNREGNNKRECKITILYKDNKEKNSSLDHSLDIKELIENYFKYLRHEDKVTVYLKYFHNHGSTSTSSSSSSSSSSGSKKGRRTASQVFDEHLRKQCIKLIQEDIKSVEVHKTLYNEQHKLRVKITIHYKDETKDKKRIRKEDLLELYEDCINPDQRKIVDQKPPHDDNSETKPYKPARREPSPIPNHNNRNNIMALERQKPLPKENESESENDCECTMF